MRELLEYLVKEITGRDDLTIEEGTLDEFKVYTIVAPKEVMGLLIGKEGRTIRALRNISKIRGVRDGERVRIEVQEQGTGQEETRE